MIYFCIPAYNEARTVGVLLWKIRQVMTDFPRDYRILVVDDASTDTTQEVLEPYARVLPLEVIRHDERRGYAASLERLLREAVEHTPYPKRDAVVVLQADFTDEPEAIPDLLKRFESGADVVASAARRPDRDEPARIRWPRRLIDSMLARLEWPDEVSDPLSGFRAYRIICVRKAIRAAEDGPLLKWDGWAANAELLQSVIPFARRVDEIEIEVQPRRRQRPTRFRPLRALRHFWAFFRARRELAPEIGEALGKLGGGSRRRRRGRRDAGSSAGNGAGGPGSPDGGGDGRGGASESSQPTGTTAGG